MRSGRLDPILVEIIDFIATDYWYASKMLQTMKEKTCKFLSYRFDFFCFVAEADRISNLKLVEDIYKILIFIDSKISI
jgi:hypothetical protein